MGSRRSHVETRSPGKEGWPDGRPFGERIDFTLMQGLRAVVRNGRLVMDEPTELPEGTELTLTVLDEGDDLDDADRARLHESLRRSMTQAKAGRLIDGDKVIDRLLARR
jgi:hypothetical protein